LTPKFPLIVVEPVLVTAEAPKTAKLCAEPRNDGTANAGEAAQRSATIGTMTASAALRPRRVLADFILNAPSRHADRNDKNPT
jgi:hypothetical protein